MTPSVGALTWADGDSGCISSVRRNGSERRRLFSTACTASRSRQSAVRRSGGVGAECARCAPAFSDATMPTVRESVNDFETAKLRRGVQARLHTRSNARRFRIIANYSMSSALRFSG